MTSRALPLVSIITPLYNNAEHLSECIESVLAQTYPHWDYTIVNNCSTDRSFEIASRYAAKDPRIKVHNNSQFLPVIANHNHALRQISPDCRYAKMVFADDWLFPRCIEEMVVLAEQNPSVGIVGAYGLEEDRVAWQGLPISQPVISGREICRRMFLDDLYVFGTPNSILYRADLVREQPAFFNEANFQADREACVALLKNCDFGFIHQILTFKRLAAGSLTRAVGWYLMTHYGTLLLTIRNHAADFLSRDEVEFCQNRLLAEYYNFLAVSILRGNRDSKFWSYHKARLNETVGFSRLRLVGATLGRICRMIFSPYETFSKMRTALLQRAMSAKSRRASGQEFRAHAVEFEKLR
ncbi:MAG TPA: glycosyltransferase family 2 protein [Edaphobacter sp.]